ncbi:MAG: class I SAM-dependent methyltransferase [Chlorobi bacterium]|nr:class I SAM-dependent methyltransferase [Chlorobiota bacterium]MCI0716664.1 class I SAM-dependent methyltransferase [Chlorobiota bacterium]
MHNSTTRFSDKVENYIKYRPHYPAEVINYLKSEKILKDDSVIADIGSGTGISTEMFLKNGNTVHAVEPNQEMREAAERTLSNYKNFISVNGTAEKTTLPNASIDLITAAQAFHWFDLNKTKSEFKRILKPKGYVVLLWNARLTDTTPFLKDYEKMLVKYGTDYLEVRHENFGKVVFEDFFEGKYKIKTFENRQVFDYDGVKGRLLSSSYIPKETNPNYLPMLKELKRIFDLHNKNGKVTIKYETQVITGKL